MAALPAIWLFLKAEADAEDPMMPLSLFRNATFAGANAVTVVLYAALSASLFLLPFLLIKVHGYSAAAAGAAFLPFSLIMGLGSRWSGGLVEKTGPRAPLALGAALTAGGFAVLAFSSNLASYWTGVLPGLLLAAIGMTLCVAPLTTAVFNAAPSEKSGAASGINNAAARAGGLLAIAALGLAFGGTDTSSLDGSVLTQAYRLVMLCAAVLAALSSLTAALTVAPQTTEPRAVS